jgi:hypothetical protein
MKENKKVRLERLWKIADDSFMEGNFDRSRRALEILLRFDPEHGRVQNRLDVAELRPEGPPWKFISMSNERIDRLFAHGDDDPADYVLPEESMDPRNLEVELILYGHSPSLGDAEAEQIELKLKHDRRGKDPWKA